MPAVSSSNQNQTQHIRSMCTALWTHPMSEYPVLHKGAFSFARFLFFGCLGSRASTETKIPGQSEQHLRAVFFIFQVQKKC